MDSAGNFVIGGFSSESGLVDQTSTVPNPIVAYINTARSFSWCISVTSTSYDMKTTSTVKFTPDGSKIYVSFDYPTTGIDLVILRLMSTDGSLDTSLLHTF